MSPVWGVVLVTLSFSQLVNGHFLDCKVDICFALEQFGCRSDWNNAKTMITTLVYMMDIGPDATQFGLVQFARDAQPVFDLDDHDNKVDVMDAINHLSPVGHKHIKLRSALNATRTDCFGAGHGERVSVLKLAIILTNGNNRIEISKTAAAAKALRSDNITMLSVGVNKPDVDIINILSGHIAANTFLPRPVLQEPILLPSGIYNFGSVVTDLYNRVKDICARGHNTPGVDCNDLTGGSGRLQVNIATPGQTPDYREALCENWWMVLLRRQDGSVDFARPWAYYRDGFGSLDREFWVGLDLMHHVTNNGHNYSLRVDFQLYNGTKSYALYSSFSVGPASDYYRLHVTGYDPRSTLGNSLQLWHNGKQFTTTDEVHDVKSQPNSIGPNCSQLYGQGGWWYWACHSVQLTGIYGKYSKYGQYPFVAYGKGIMWHVPWGSKKFAQRTSMKICRTL